MAVNDKIKRTDYNTVQTIVSNILGTGASNRGYGQPVQSSQVNLSNRITVNEWNNLANDLKSIGRHQNGSTPSLPQATANNIIKFNSSTEPYDRYLTVANTYDTNRFNLGALQFTTTNNGSRSNTFAWKNEAYVDITVTFDNSENARNFFNAGGLIQMRSTRTGGTLSGGASTINAQNRSWTDFLNATGYVSFGGATPRTGTTPLNGGNYFRNDNNFSGSSVTVASDSSPYGANKIVFDSKTNVANNSNGTANTLTIRYRWRDDHVAIPGATVDGVDGTLTIFVQTITPTGSLFPSGTFTIETPAVSIGTVTRVS